MGNHRDRRQARRPWLLLVAASMGLLLLVYLAPGASAMHELEFQLDGNTVDDSTAAQDFDWQTFFEGQGGIPANDITRKITLPNAGTPGFTSSGASADYALPDTSTYATGSKDTLSISPGWQCKKSNNVGDKVDILNAYSTAYTDPVSGDQFLYFGIETSSPNGNNNVAVWFLRDGSVGCSTTAGGNQAFVGNHMAGDLLLVSAFTNGGTQANVAAYVWQGDDNTGSLNPNPVATGGLCPGPADPHPSPSGVTQTACATVNQGSIQTGWKSPDKTGGDLDALEFFEGGINLTDSGFTDACFARFLANTRSSQELTATLFDFTTGELALCAPSTSLSVSPSGPTIHTGDSVTITISETNDGINPLLAPTPGNANNGGFITVDPSTTCTPTHVLGSDSDGLPSDSTHNVGDADNDGVLDIGETWSFTCTFSPTATTTVKFLGHGILDKGGGIKEDVTSVFSGSCTNVPGTTTTVGRFCDADELKSVTVTVLAPSTILTKTASITVTYRYTEFNDGNAELTKPVGGWVTDDKCSPVNEVTKTVTIDGQQVTRNTGDTDNDNELDPGETFVFTCTTTATTQGTNVDVTNRAVGHGIDGLSFDVTFCPDLGNVPASTICDNQEVDDVRVRVDHLAPPSPTPSPTPSP
jgi:hypothetical protein